MLVAGLDGEAGMFAVDFEGGEEIGSEGFECDSDEFGSWDILASGEEWGGKFSFLESAAAGVILEVEAAGCVSPLLLLKSASSTG